MKLPLQFKGMVSFTIQYNRTDILLVPDDRCGVGVTSQHAEIDVPAAFALNLLSYAPLGAYIFMIVLASYLIGVMIISTVLRTSNLSMELEACYMCPKQALAFVKKALVRAMDIQLTCRNRRQHFYDGPIGKAHYDPQIRSCVARKEHSQGTPPCAWRDEDTNVEGRNIGKEISRRTSAVPSMVPLEWPSRSTAPVPRFCEIAPTLRHTYEQRKKRLSGHLSVLPCEGARVCSTSRQDANKDERGRVAKTRWQG